MSALLALDLLTRRFGGITAVDALSMQVEEGEIRGLIGPNGAGKTTTLDLISGLIPPTSGRMTLEQTNVTGEPAHRLAKRGIRRTFQNLKLFAELTVLQNVMIGLHAQGTSGVLQAIIATGKQRREEQMMVGESLAALETVGLADQAGRPASALAYGHRRLLEIARAIVARPILLLLDEPAAGRCRSRLWVFSLGDEVPHIFIRESHQRPRKILITGGKRLFQQHRPTPVNWQPILL
jgi:branched-chain amino acid transport system ATP-binding protein